MAYRYGGKQKLLAIGPYPLVSLSDARQAREEAKRALLGGRDPSEMKRAAIAAAKAGPTSADDDPYGERDFGAFDPTVGEFGLRPRIWG